MIAEREQNRPAAVEEERVMEAINARREKRKAEAAADAARGTTASGASTPNTARSATASRGVCAEYRVWQENGAVEVGCA